MPSRLTTSDAISVPRSTASAELAAETFNRQDSLAEEVIVLFDQYRDPLLRYLSSFGLSPADGEDVIQEVFLALFRHLRSGKPRDNLRGWLFRVAHNLALKQRWRARRDFEMRAAAADDVAVDPGPGPEDQMTRNQAHQRVLSVVGALAEQDRRCIFLRAEGLRYREIASVLDMSLGAVSLSLARTLARIARSGERR
jgi:RNA polymerase sigma-70 factor (ECF subfamily)